MWHECRDSLSDMNTAVSSLLERKMRAARIVRALKKAYPVPKTELQYETPFQLVAAVMMSAQCTDKAVNKTTAVIYKKYKSVADFAQADPDVFQNEISSITFFRNKTKHILATAQYIAREHAGIVPHSEEELVKLPGIGYKTAHVIMGELYEKWEGIPTDTHVKRFAHRFDLTQHTDLKKISKDLESLVPKKEWRYVNNGLVLYGRYVCPARKHDCTQHLLTKIWSPAANRWPKA